MGPSSNSIEAGTRCDRVRPPNMTTTRPGWLHVVLLTLALSGCGGGTSTVSNAAAPGAASIGGTLSGLASGESVGLQLNGGDPRTISANGTFTLSSSIAINGSYSVTVAAAPAGQTCTVAGGEGMVTSVTVDNIVVTCTDQAFC